ncbi:MAG TPA: hypothetical protein PLM79_00540 [Syntrophobacteraceae bacterium]|nr:hypothetical protein [Syntrophobacteraceae bacterium]
MATMDDPEERRREVPGAFTGLVFVVFGLYFHIAFFGIHSLLTARAFLFLVPGMYVTAILVGVPFYVVRGGILNLTLRLLKEPVNRSHPSMLKCITTASFVLEMVVVCLLSKKAFLWFYAGSNLRGL